MRHRINVHQVADMGQACTQPAAGVEDPEIGGRKAAAFQQGDRQGVADDKLHRGGRRRRQPVRAGFGRLRQQQHDIGILRHQGRQKEGKEAVK